MDKILRSHHFWGSSLGIPTPTLSALLYHFTLFYFNKLSHVTLSKNKNKESNKELSHKGRKERERRKKNNRGREKEVEREKQAVCTSYFKHLVHQMCTLTAK
jgi:hypothetical protein